MLIPLGTLCTAATWLSLCVCQSWSPLLMRTLSCWIRATLMASFKLHQPRKGPSPDMATPRYLRLGLHLGVWTDAVRPQQGRSQERTRGSPADSPPKTRPPWPEFPAFWSSHRHPRVNSRPVVSTAATQEWPGRGGRP